MFNSLKKKLSSSIKKLSRKTETLEELKKEVYKEIEHIAEEQKGIEEPIKEEEISDELPEEKQESLKEPIVEEIKLEPEEKIEEELHIKKPKLGLKDKLVKRIKIRELSEKDINGFFKELEIDLLEANVALEVVDFLKRNLKESLVGKELKRRDIENIIKKSFEDSLLKIVDQGNVNIDDKQTLLFLGFNGAGKTTSIAKVANYLKDKGKKVVLAAGDSFRAAAIEQLQIHGERLNLNVIKHDYGADSAAVIFDAIKHAQAKGIDHVLADTAGRTHTNTNLVDELKKICRVNKPDLKILVIDSLTGNDAVEQARKFEEEIGVDCVMFTKIDVNEKGGSILSVCYAIKKPILFLGVGQDYKDIVRFDAKKFVKELLE